MYVKTLITKIYALLFRARPESVHYINGSETLPAPLEKEREGELIAQLGGEGREKERS